MYISYNSPWMPFKGRYVNFSCVNQIFISEEEDLFKINIEFSKTNRIQIADDFETYEKAEEKMNEMINNMVIGGGNTHVCGMPT